MGMIYRTPLLLTRKQPFVDWLRSLDEPEGLDDSSSANLTAAVDVYLVHAPAHEPTLEEMVVEYWQDLFEEELWNWMTDELTWPADRTRAMFDAWFDVRLGDTVVDLVPDDPLTDDDMDAADVEAAIHECAWCGAALEEEQGRLAGFAIDRPERLAHRAGRIFDVVVNRNRVVTGILSPPQSEPAQAGDDIVFKTCSRDCERALKSAVPRALRAAMRAIPDVH
jgi:hypothetical protein